jgi:hypothetical protein
MQTNSMNKSQSLIKTKTSKGEFKKEKKRKRVTVEIHNHSSLFFYFNPWFDKKKKVTSLNPIFKSSKTKI